MINTKCAFCLFRTNDGDGFQNGCSLGRLNKFIDRGEAVKEEDYYSINRFCNTCRSEGYTKESVLKEVQISCTFIVYGWNDYWQTLKSILKQTIMPTNTFVVFDDMRLFNIDKYKEYQELFNNKNSPLIFKRYFEDKPFRYIINDIVNKVETQFYIPVKRQIKPDFIENYNKIINYDLKQLNAHFKSTLFESFISCNLHKRFNGNNDRLLVSKLKEFVSTLESEEQKQTIIFDKQYE